MSKTCVCGNDMTKAEWNTSGYVIAAGEQPISIKKTNADKYFRNATDEELARWCNDYNFNCPPVECEENGCEKCWLDWLKQEVEGDV